MSEDKTNFGFSFDEVEDEKGYELLPAGEYTAMITNAEMKQPSDTSKPEYLNIQYSVENGDSVANVWDVLVINHGDGTTAQNIARSRLKSIGTACGLSVDGFNNPEQLIDRSLKLKVAIKKDKEYGDKNIVKKVMPLVEAEAETKDVIDDEMPNF